MTNCQVKEVDTGNVRENPLCVQKDLGGYSIIPTIVLRDTRLSPTDLRLLMLIGTNSWKTGYSWMSNSRISHELKIGSIRTIQISLKNLEKNEYIKLRFNKANTERTIEINSSGLEKNIISLLSEKKDDAARYRERSAITGPGETCNEELPVNTNVIPINDIDSPNIFDSAENCGGNPVENCATKCYSAEKCGGNPVENCEGNPVENCAHSNIYNNIYNNIISTSTEQSSILPSFNASPVGSHTETSNLKSKNKEQATEQSPQVKHFEDSVPTETIDDTSPVNTERSFGFSLIQKKEKPGRPKKKNWEKKYVKLTTADAWKNDYTLNRGDIVAEFGQDIYDTCIRWIDGVYKKVPEMMVGYLYGHKFPVFIRDVIEKTGADISMINNIIDYLFYSDSKNANFWSKTFTPNILLDKTPTGAMKYGHIVTAMKEDGFLRSKNKESPRTDLGLAKKWILKNNDRLFEISGRYDIEINYLKTKVLETAMTGERQLFPGYPSELISLIFETGKELARECQKQK